MEQFSEELISGLESVGKDVSVTTHKFYWEGNGKNKIKPIHPSENDEFIPAEIRGNHYNSWKDIAADLGYGER